MFISDKLAEEITLTIGQAFELAYRRFLDTSGKDLESQRRAMVTQQRIKRLEQEVNIYKKRLLDMSQFPNIKPDLDQYLRKQELKNILEVPAAVNGSSMNDSSSSLDSDHVNGNKLVDLMSSNAENTTNGNYTRIVFFIKMSLYFYQYRVAEIIFNNINIISLYSYLAYFELFAM